MPAYGSESVEYLVKRSVVEMDGTDMPGDRSPTTTCWMFDCLSAREKVQGKREGYAHRRASRRIGMLEWYPGRERMADRSRRRTRDESPVHTATPR